MWASSAMAGSISGAYLGLTGIPPKAFDEVALKLHDATAPEWDLKRLLLLVDDLYLISTGEEIPETREAPEPSEDA